MALGFPCPVLSLGPRAWVGRVERASGAEAHLQLVGSQSRIHEPDWESSETETQDRAGSSDRTL